MRTKKQFKNGKRRRALRIIGFLLILLCILVARSIVWVLSEWADLQIDEIVWQLTSPLRGTGGGIISSYMKEVLPFTLAVFVMIMAVYFLMGKFRLLKTNRLYIRFVFIAALAVAFSTVTYFCTELHAVEWLINRHKESSFIEDHYVNPDDVQLTFPKKKRNLLYIYLESTEITYTDKKNGGAFDEDVIPEMTQLAESDEAEDFEGKDHGTTLNGGIALSDTTFTMGAMFGDTSGLPLKISINRNRMDTQTQFFPSITTLGDILDKEGYRQILLIGSQSVFGGRKLYFTSHGNYEMRDYDYYKNNGTLPQGYKVWWGFEDEKLFQYAKDTLSELDKGGQPWNLTMLTVDTHFTDGYVCRLCRDDFSDQYSNVFACASRQVTQFLEWAKTQDWYDDTAIILTGDHPTMDANYCQRVPRSYQRKTYTAFINSAVKPAENRHREYATLDYFPTTLAAMGVKIDGDRLGLGTNLFSNKETLVEKYGATEINLQIDRHSSFMEKLEGKVKAATADVKISDYNPETKSIHVKVTNLKPDIFTEVQIKVGNDGEKKVSTFLSDDGTGTYEGDVDLSYRKSGEKVKIQVKARQYVNGTRLHGGPHLIEPFQLKIK